MCGGFRACPCPFLGPVACVGKWWRICYPIRRVVLGWPSQGCRWRTRELSPPEIPATAGACIFRQSSMQVVGLSIAPPPPHASFLVPFQAGRVWAAYHPCRDQSPRGQYTLWLCTLAAMSADLWCLEAPIPSGSERKIHSSIRFSMMSRICVSPRTAFTSLAERSTCNLRKTRPWITTSGDSHVGRRRLPNFVQFRRAHRWEDSCGKFST